MTKKDAIKIFEDKKLCAVTSYTIHGLKMAQSETLGDCVKILIFAS